MYSKASARTRHRFTLAVPMILMAATLSLVSSSALADMRCGGKLISVGTPKATVAILCGVPFLKDFVGVERHYSSAETVTDLLVEEWAYPSAGIDGFRVLRFIGGRLTASGMRCAEGLVSQGDTKASVKLRCGDPMNRVAIGSVSASPASPTPLGDERVAARKAEPVATTVLEQWVYRRGKGKFLQIITFRGGVVGSIEDGPRE